MKEEILVLVLERSWLKDLGNLQFYQIAAKQRGLGDPQSHQIIQNRRRNSGGGGVESIIKKRSLYNQNGKRGGHREHAANKSISLQQSSEGGCLFLIYKAFI